MLYHAIKQAEGLVDTKTTQINKRDTQLKNGDLFYKRSMATIIDLFVTFYIFVVVMFPFYTLRFEPTLFELAAIYIFIYGLLDACHIKYRLCYCSVGKKIFNLCLVNLLTLRFHIRGQKPYVKFAKFHHLECLQIGFMRRLLRTLTKLSLTALSMGLYPFIVSSWPLMPHDFIVSTIVVKF